MDQNTNNITLADILRMFKGKMTKIICLALIVGVLASAVGAWLAVSDASYSGNVLIYMTPADESHSILNLVNSDRFSEALLLDEYGLPSKEYCDEDEYNAALEAAKVFYAARAAKAELVREDELFSYSFAIVEQQYNRLHEEYQRIFQILSIYKNAQTDTVVDPSHIATTNKYEALLEEAENARNKYAQEVRNAEIQKRLELDKKIAEANRHLDDTRKEYTNLSEKILTKWRNDPEIQSLIRQISSAIKCEYKRNLTTEEMDSFKDESAIIEYNNKHILDIQLSTGVSEEFAEYVIDLVKEKAPLFLALNLEKYYKTTKSDCTVLSTVAGPSNSVKANAIENAIIYGAIGAVASILIHSVVIVIGGFLPPDIAPKKKNKKSKNKDEQAA